MFLSSLLGRRTSRNQSIRAARSGRSFARRRSLRHEALEPRRVLDSVGLDPLDAVPLERVIVQLQDDVADVGQAAEGLLQPLAGRLGHVYEHALKGFSAQLPPAAVDALQNHPLVKLVEPSIMMHALGQTVPTGVDRIDAEPSLSSLTGDVDVDVAIIDSGIHDHPDLNVVGGRHFYTVTTGPPSGRGTHQDDNYDDDYGHGTHVAGIAAAMDEAPETDSPTDGNGYVGVAPGARLWAVKVLDSNGLGSVDDIVAGVDWVTAHAAEIEVANMSIGVEGQNSTLRTAIQNSVAAGVVYMVAAGNDAQDVYGEDGTFGIDNDFIPAAYPEAATISALADSDGQPGGDDSFASFSNYSSSVVAGNPVNSPGAAIDLIMPGVDIWSTYIDNQYVSFSGTSMAAPHAAGLAALYIAENGRASDAAGVYAIRQALIDAGVPQDDPDRGLSVPNDPDSNLENLGWAVAIPDGIEVATTCVCSPGSVYQGDVMEIRVTVQNLGDQGTTSAIEVTLTDETDGGEIGRQTVDGLAAGASTTLTFSWDTTGAIRGDHTLTATHDFSDGDDYDNDSSSGVITVEETATTTTDVAVTSVDAPGSVAPGSLVDVLVTVENVGNQDVTTINVTLQDDTAKITIDTQTIDGLAAGASTTLTFFWDTTGASLGEHTLTATQDLTDDFADNDSMTTAVTVQEASDTMHVADLDGSKNIKGRSGKWEAFVTVFIADSNDPPAAVANATVTGEWSGATSGTVSGTTASDGTVTFASGDLRDTSVTFTVTDVTYETMLYAPGDNADPDGDSDGTTIIIYKDPTGAGAMIAEDADGLEAMCRELAWYHAFVQEQTGTQSENAESDAAEVVDYLMMQPE